MALASTEGLSFTYPGGGEPALREVSVSIEAGEAVALLGPSGSGKSTLLRALAGLVPHFHGGRFEGRVSVAGRDTRRHRPADLAGTVATLFQDPEDQLVFSRVDREVAFGLENVGTPPAEIGPRTLGALASAGAAHLSGRRLEEVSGGELQRVCLAAALALDPELLLLDEPSSQLDSESADVLERALDTAGGRAVVVAEQRPQRILDLVDRVIFVESGRVLLDAPVDAARAWLAAHRPAYLFSHTLDVPITGSDPVTSVCRFVHTSFAYRPEAPVVEDESLELRRGEVAVLTGPNGSGKTTVAKLAAGLLSPSEGVVERQGRAAYLAQDPGRYLITERAVDEVALGVGGDRRRARDALAKVGLDGFEERHPHDLSSGERERLALACVLVTEPDLLVLDEPTRGLDPERRDEIVALLRAEAARRATLVVTNDVVFADAIADRRIERGRPRKLEPALA
jgi:energy-coupling factor transport system ATP-binding protein